jgi:hypothetical protein
MSATRIYLTICLLALLICPATLVAREVTPEPDRIQSSNPTDSRAAVSPYVTRDGFFRSSAAVSVIDTYVLAEFTFDGPSVGCDAQGWTSVDVTAPTGIYFHVDDFAGLGGGDYGRLVPLQGTKSLWCGARADSTSEVYCAYARLPGYGNNWDQRFVSAGVPVNGDMTLGYRISWDTEQGYDFTYVQYIDTSGSWVELASYSGVGLLTESWVIPESELPESLFVRFRFVSDGAYSDEDGNAPSDGAVIIDQLKQADTSGVINFANFEIAEVGATETVGGEWSASVTPGYGDFAAMYRGTEVVQEDPCVSNLTCMWGFFNGSTYDYSCGGYPGQPAVPYENERGQFIDNQIRSPWIEWNRDENGDPVPVGSQLAYFQADVYSDLPLENLVAYIWNVRFKDASGCPELWESDGFFWHGENYPEWRTRWSGRAEINSFAPATATHVQVALRVMDICQFYCGQLGSGDCHSHAPLFDNMRVIRLDSPGPIYDAYAVSRKVRNMHMFQDNFPVIADTYRPGSGELTSAGKVRLDLGLDTNWDSDRIMPGDSLVANITELTVGLDRDVSGGPAAYIHVRDLPGKSGEALSGGPRWPYVPGQSGAGWTAIRMDSIPLTFHPQDQFCVDLNDNLFEPGDTIEYYLSARDNLLRTTYWTWDTETTTDLAAVQANPMEVTCLPANGLNGVADILYVNVEDGTGVAPYLENDFRVLGVAYDRYDVNLNGREQGLGGAVKDVVTQLIPYYRKIIWSSGKKSVKSVDSGEKTDEWGLLRDFVEQHTEDCGVYFTGDGLAEEWSYLPTWEPGGALRVDYMDFTLFNNDHTAAGLQMTPQVIARAGSIFDGPSGPDTTLAYGGCPDIRRFDVLMPAEDAVVEMDYSGNPVWGAVMSQATVTSDTTTARIVLAGFSYDVIRDDRTQVPYDRVAHLDKVLTWLGNGPFYPTAAEAGPGLRNHLAQNYPNPFNPTTRIQYSVRENARVSLRVYNVAGQLVRTLVNDVKTPGPHTVTWEGTNNTGSPVASGVYFYRMTTRGFTQTRKLTILK